MQRIGSGLAAVLLVGFLGCGANTASVSGTGRFGGSPVGRGFINFLPAGGNAEAAGGPITKGAYHVTDIPLGSKKVEIIGVKETAFAATSEEMRRQAEAAQGGAPPEAEKADEIPADAVGNGQTLEVTAGSHRKDFSLTKPAP